MTLPPILAVDFDGCLCTNAWPKIGDPNFKALYELKKRKARGCKLILWTCRAGEALDEAVRWCAQWDLHFDAINQNLPEVIDLFGGDTRKIYANEYWDDKGGDMPCIIIQTHNSSSSLPFSAGSNRTGCWSGSATCAPGS